MALEIVLASAGIAALISATGSLFAVHLTNRHLETVEDNKHKQAILEYRCEKLYSFLERIVAEVGYVFCKTTYKQDGTLVKEAIRKNGEIIEGKSYEDVCREQYDILLGIWLLAEPLIDSDEAKAEVEKNTCEELRDEFFHKSLVEAIRTQLRVLLVEQTKNSGKEATRHRHPR